MICGCILLIAVVLPIVYTAIYTSQLEVHHHQALVKSAEDVAANPNIKVFTTKGFNPATYVLVCIRETNTFLNQICDEFLPLLS